MATGSAASPQGACTLSAASVKARNGAGWRSATGTYVGPAGGFQNCSISYVSSSGSTCNACAATQILTGTATQCPGYIDFYDPANSIAAGSPKGPDGLCRTGTYGPVSRASLGSRVSANPPSAADYATWNSAMGTAQSQDGLSVGSGTYAPTVTGPASQTGTAVTTSTTGPTGTTTQTQTPTYNYSYAGDRITYNTTNVQSTTVTPTGGSPTTTTTTTTNAQAAAQDVPTQCDKYPDSVGCLKLGDAPSDAIPKSTKTVPMVTEEAVALPSQCPADLVLANGHGVISYAVPCNTANQLRPLLVASALLAAALMVVATLRGA